MVLGVLIVAYPTISDWWNSFHQTRAIASYTEQVAAMDTGEAERMLKEAEAYNAELVEKEHRFAPTEEDLAYYNSILDVTGTGIMGYVEIPKLHISFPIYHGSDETILQIAIGHLEGTSFPVGGAGTHAALTGHRGLPSARLFTDIDQLVDGDHFAVHILNRTVTYEVDQIHIVLPEEMEDLQIDPEHDYCTLITCTPYGINSHRLLVRGRRVENDLEISDVSADAQQVQPGLTALGIAIPMLTAALIYILIMTSIKASKKKKQKQGKENTL
jgi:sortase A